LLRRSRGNYQTQAAIAAVHARDDGNYSELLALYDRLAGGAVVALNRAVAIGMAHGPEAGLAAIDALPASDYYLLPAARADFLRRLERLDEAAVEYRRALSVVKTDEERRYLARRLKEVEG
jgi:RNA polymerase sigma-70 factor, ECF subfamily